jgi:hypothetical protein
VYNLLYLACQRMLSYRQSNDYIRRKLPSVSSVLHSNLTLYSMLTKLQTHL